jgi:DNA repair protein RecO (recombination protein O)
MLVKTHAIVLHFVKYAESSIIASLYTEMFGRQAFLINAVRTRKSKYPASFFQPLTVLEIDMYYKAGRDIQRIKEIACPWHFHSIPFTVTKSTIALFISEILYKTLKEEEANPQLFHFLASSIQLLDMKDEGIQNFHLVFLLQYSKFLGIYPLQTDSDGIHADQSLFLLSADFTDGEKRLLEQLANSSLSTLDSFELSNSTRGLLLDKLLNFLIYYLDQNTKIRSLKVLKEVFQR